MNKYIIFRLVLMIVLVSCEKTQSESQIDYKSLDADSSSTLSNPVTLFDENSITKDYLNKNTQLKWKNILGDWIDTKGVSQGSADWSSANISRGMIGPIIIDVTSLAKDQQGKKNQLMIFSATVPIRISSREGNHSPILKVMMEDGSLLSLNPTLDCSIALSTHRNINTKELSFNVAGEKTFIQFPVPNQEIKTATLELWPIKIYGTGQIQIFNLNFKKNISETLKGLASTKSSYAELKSHPDVIFIDTFDSTSIKKEWIEWTGGKSYSSEHLKNRYFAGVIDQNNKSHSAVNLRYFFKKNINREPTEIYLRYSVRFHQDFVNATQGGKLPGQAGTYNTCGWGGRRPDLECPGWSARMAWSLPITEGPFKDLIPIGTYLYHLDQQGFYGDIEMWQAYCKLGNWCELEQYVKLNTPGEKDGVLIGYHNGKKVYERKDIRYRATEKIKIEDIWGLIYHGGTGYPTKPIHVDLDNVVISKSYIGLIEQANQSLLNKSIEPQNIKQNSQNKTTISKNTPTFSESNQTPNSITSFRRKANATPKIAFSPNPRFKKLTDNSVIDLGEFSCTQPLGDNISCKRVTDFSGLVYDQNHHQLVMFGGGHSASFTDSVFLFNFNTLTWSEDYLPTPCTAEYMSMENFNKNQAAWIKGPTGPYPRPISRHTYDLLAIASGLPELIMLIGPNGDSSCPPNSKGYDYTYNGAKVAHYQLEKKIWTFSKSAGGDGYPFYNFFQYTASEYDPISGMVILLGRYGLYVYDPIKRTKIRIIDNSRNQFVAEDIGYANELVYYPPNDKMYYFNRNSQSVWELSLNRNHLEKSILKKVSVTGKYPEHTEPGYAYDSINEIIGGAIFNNTFNFFNPKTMTWAKQVVIGGEPGLLASHAIAYDPINNVYIFLTKGYRTWAYRFRAKTDV